MRKRTTYFLEVLTVLIALAAFIVMEWVGWLGAPSDVQNALSVVIGFLGIGIPMVSIFYKL